ncbi:hypothetical protein TNCV_4807291 [Trichonephila clavipes]|nr:hypothetical protein TNCV_4807291 [Trichonephila clavipes]
MRCTSIRSCPDTPLRIPRQTMIMVLDHLIYSKSKFVKMTDLRARISESAIMVFFHSPTGGCRTISGGESRWLRGRRDVITCFGAGQVISGSKFCRTLVCGWT